MDYKIEESLTYSDILLKPQFSLVRSRNDVTLDHTFLGMKLGLPLISSNMDTVTNAELASVLATKGAVASLHRFQTIDQNIQEFNNSYKGAIGSRYNRKPIVSFGIGTNELDRAVALVEAGAETLLLDVAHGAAIHVVEQYDLVRSKVGKDVKIIVGNFDNYNSVAAFLYHIKSGQYPDALKIGIGNGAACITRTLTGHGGGMISALMSFKGKTSIPLIADGGIKMVGDIAKALACGASSVMLGSYFAGTDEAPGEAIYGPSAPMLRDRVITHKKYRGSASYESYEVQGKVSEHRAPEGESFLVPYKGPVAPILDNIAAGLKSALSYTGAASIIEFKELAEIVKASPSTHTESFAHGKSR